MSFLSISTVAFCLMLFGFSILVSTNLQYASEQIKSQFEISAYIDDKITDVSGIEAQIKQIEGINTYTFESREEALKKFVQTQGLGTESFDGLEQDNPLRSSFNITLKDLSQTGAVADKISKISGVVNVVNRQDILNGIISFTSASVIISVLILLIFALISMFIIYNTIKLAVNSRKNEIAIMKLVGATDWFIRWPFIFEGVIVGFVGACIAYIPVILGYQYVVFKWQNSLEIFKLISVNSIYGTIILLFLLMGAFIGAMGSLLSVRKYLHV